MEIPVEILSIDLEQLDLNEKARAAFELTLNFLEVIVQEKYELQTRVQSLEDTINHLKGEKGRLKRTPNVPKRENKSQPKRKRPKTRRKRSKKSKIKIDRTEKVNVDKTTLPPDAEFKGYDNKKGNE